MTNLNMAKVSTLFKKGYLLAGVVMAANMFAVNEMKASSSNPSINVNQQTLEQQYPPVQNPLGNTNNDKEKNDDNTITVEKSNKKKQVLLYKLLSGENYFNLFGTLALSGANNYFKLWDYNAGRYLNLRIGCLGWRTKKFFDIVQLDFNLNLWRGIGWSIPHIIKFRRSLTKAQIQDNTEIKQNEEENDAKSGSNTDSWVSFLFKDILRGFISIPLTFHFSNFSISISFDSILWEFVIGKFFDLGKNNKKKEDIEKKEIYSSLTNQEVKD